MGPVGERFEKQRSCPSPALLLSYHQAHRSIQQTPQVAAHVAHVATCDFCAAEIQLLAKHYSAEVVCEGAEMPPHLSALAAALD
jgi:hypothetical protein